MRQGHTHRRSLSPAIRFKQHASLHDAHSPIPIHFKMNWVGFVVDAQTGMLPGVPESAVCVQRFDDSLNLTIHTTYRNSLRSSSLREPRHPLLAVVFVSCSCKLLSSQLLLENSYKVKNKHYGAHKVLGYCVNDPSAGSPTETLLRLLLPLDNKV